MTRLLATGDNHFHEHTRFEECTRVHAWMVGLAKELEVDVVLVTGDLYEAESTPLERARAASWLMAMAEIAPVILVEGNHEAHGDISILRQLRSTHPIIVEEGAGVHYVGDVAVAAFAWPDTAALTSRASTVARADEDIRGALRDVFRGLGAELRKWPGPRIAMGHCMIDGSIASTNQPLLGLPLNVSLEELALIGAHLGVYGHIHRSQWWVAPDGSQHGYVGSPFRTDFGQTEPKTVTFAEFAGSRLVNLRHFETPAAPMVHLEFDWDGSAFVERDRGTAQFALAHARGSELRVRYHVPADQRAAAGAYAECLAETFRTHGAVNVQSEPVVVTEKRARAPKVALASGLTDKLTEHWSSVGFDPGDRRAALLEKAHRLEGETRDVPT